VGRRGPFAAACSVRGKTFTFPMYGTFGSKHARCIAELDRCGAVPEPYENTVGLQGVTQGYTLAAFKWHRLYKRLIGRGLKRVYTAALKTADPTYNPLQPGT